MTNIYNYDKNKIFTFAEEAQVNPLEGGILMPPNATLIAPPEVTDDELAVFNGSSWKVMEKPKTTEPEAPLNPELTLEELKTVKSDEINFWRLKARHDEGAEFAQDIFDVDETSQSNILAKVITANLNPTASFIYRSKTNINHTFSSSEIVNLGFAIGAKVEEIYQKSWDLKELVNQATTRQELEAISWN